MNFAFLQSKIAYTLKSVTEMSRDRAMGIIMNTVMMNSAGPRKIKMALNRVFISNSFLKICHPSLERDGRWGKSL